MSDFHLLTAEIRHQRLHGGPTTRSTSATRGTGTRRPSRHSLASRLRSVAERLEA